MQTNPYSSPQPVDDEARVVKRGRTLFQMLAAIAIWMLALAWAAIGTAVTFFASPPGVRFDLAYRYVLSAIFIAMFVLPVIGLTLIGLSYWRASMRFFVWGIAMFAPLAMMVAIRALFW
jgi:hypothetical protein